MVKEHTVTVDIGRRGGSKNPRLMDPTLLITEIRGAQSILVISIDGHS